MSRRQQAFENSPAAGGRSEFAVKSRVYVAQIESVDPLNGAIRVRTAGVQDSKQANLPLGGLHYAGFGSSWSRYMPEPGAFVRVAYGPRNELEVINFVAYGDDVAPDGAQRSGSFAPRVGGYSTLAKYARDNVNSMRIFRTLKPGEFDMRSAGGAGYYFTREGHATIEAGATAWELDKDRMETIGTANLHAAGGDGVQVQWGDVKRVQPGSVLPKTVTPNPASAPAPKEWRVEVGYLLPPAGLPKLTFYKEEAGDVRDNAGAPINQSGTGLPLRYRKTMYDATGLLPVLTFEVDVQGNAKMTQAATAVAGGVEVAGGPVSPFKTSFFSAEHTTTTSMKLAATTTLDLGGLTGVNINSGGPATSPMVKGDMLALYMATKLVVLTAFGPSSPAIVPLLPGVELCTLAKVGQ